MSASTLKQHTPKCIANMEAMRLRREVWLSTYPDYCQECDSTGMTGNYNNGFEDCKKCLGSDRCPRCGKYWDVYNIEDETTCPNCGWDVGHVNCVPPEPQCTCHVHNTNNIEQLDTPMMRALAGLEVVHA